MARQRHPPDRHLRRLLRVPDQPRRCIECAPSALRLQDLSSNGQFARVNPYQPPSEKRTWRTMPAAASFSPTSSRRSIVTAAATVTQTFIRNQTWQATLQAVLQAELIDHLALLRGENGLQDVLPFRWPLRKKIRLIGQLSQS